MKVFSLFLTLILIYKTYCEKLSLSSLIRSNDYELEIHNVTTEDGYILKLFRIPFGRNQSASLVHRPVVVLGNCLLCDSEVYVFQGPERSLAYKLADSGYDVWLMDQRGSRSSRHSTISKKDKTFWMFSWHEIGIYDLASTLDYTMNFTGEKQVDFIGFSMGTTMFFVLMSEKPEYNAKIRKMIALAPAAYLSNLPNPMFLRGQAYNEYLIKFAARTGKLKMPPDEMNANDLLVTLCKPKNLALYGNYCFVLLESLGGSNNGNVVQEELPFYLQYYPATTSVRTHIHFEQLRDSGRFARYDYGKKMNHVMYGHKKPPNYNIGRITAPVNIIRSRTDSLVDYQSTLKLEDMLPNVESTFDIPMSNYSHVDFIMAKNAHYLVYDVVLAMLLNQY